MKACPLCQSTYEDWIDFCFHDGAPLVAKSSTPRPAAPLAFDVAPTSPPGFDATDVPEPTGLAPAAPVEAPEPPALELPTSTLAQAITVPDAPAAVVAAEVESPPAEAPSEAAPGAGAAELDPEATAGLLSALSPPEAVVEAVVPAGSGADPVVPLVQAATAALADPVVPVVPEPASPRRPPPEVRKVVDPPRAEPARAGLPLSPLVIGAAAVGGLALVALFGWFLSVRPPAKESPLATREEVATPPPAAGVPAADPPAVAAPAPAAPPPAVAPPVATTPPPVSALPTATAPLAPPPAATPAPVTAPSTPSAPTPVAVTPSDAPPEASPWSAPVAEAAPATGSLRVLSEPDGATVYVNDVSRGRAPVEMEIPYGTHSVRVVHEGYEDQSRDVQVRTREVTIPFTLRPQVVTGQLNVYGPANYRVSVDGRDVGPMPVTVTVSEGTRQFKLVSAAGLSCSTSKEVRFRAAGRPETVTLDACPQ